VIRAKDNNKLHQTLVNAYSPPFCQKRLRCSWYLHHPCQVYNKKSFLF